MSGRTKVTRNGKGGMFDLWVDDIGHSGKTFAEAVAEALPHVATWMCRSCAGTGFSVRWDGIGRPPPPCDSCNGTGAGERI